MAATQFPTYTYLAGAASVAPKGNKVPMVEGRLRDAIMVGYIIAEHYGYKPRYSDDFLSPQGPDALRLDAAMSRSLNQKGEPELYAIARQHVVRAIDAGSWDKYMAQQCVGQSGGRTFRSARATPDLMTLVLASGMASKLQIVAPGEGEVLPARTANDPRHVVPPHEPVRVPARPTAAAVEETKRKPVQGSLFDDLAA